MKISDEKRGFMATPSSDFCPNLKVHFERGKRDKRREKKIPAPPENGLGSVISVCFPAFYTVFWPGGKKKEEFSDS